MEHSKKLLETKTLIKNHVIKLLEIFEKNETQSNTQMRIYRRKLIEAASDLQVVKSKVNK